MFPCNGVEEVMRIILNSYAFSPSYLAIKDEENTKRRRRRGSASKKKKQKVRDTKEGTIYDLNYVKEQDDNDLHKIIDVTAVSENEVNLNCSGEVTFEQL